MKFLNLFQVILGVDRLDYTKGLVARLKALEYMFTAYPNWIGKVAMLQVAVPSRLVKQLSAKFYCES